MLQFGALSGVSKTYTKQSGIVRGQSYTGIKFRRAESEAGKDEAVKEGKEFKAFIDEKFIFSNAIAEKLKLTENGFMEYVDGVPTEDGTSFTSINAVYLLLTDDKNENARLLKSTTKGIKKSLSIKAPVLTADLVKAGIIDADKVGNQYLTLSEEQIEGAPEWVKGAYKIVVDETVKASDDKEEEEGQDEVEAASGATATAQPLPTAQPARNF